jgi:3',5'-cyclic AMP phosphodiesterase CpdA
MAISDKVLPALVDDLNRAQVDFSVAVGDLTQNGLADLFFRSKTMLEKLDAPWIVTVGNHDMWGYDTTEAKGLERFAAAFERKPFDVYEAGGVRVLAINSADPAASPFPPFDIVQGGFSGEPNESVPGGLIGEEAAEWLSGFVPGGPTLIFLHHPPYPYFGFPPVTFGLDEPSTKILADAVKRTRAWGVICGHTHRSALYDIAGVPMLEVPSPKEWPFGYGIVEVTDQGWSFNLLPLSDRSIYETASVKTNSVIRNYSRGPAEARGFVSKT